MVSDRNRDSNARTILISNVHFTMNKEKRQAISNSLRFIAGIGLSLYMLAMALALIVIAYTFLFENRPSTVQMPISFHHFP